MYPVSCGYNWGYGSRVPREDLSAVLELSRLRRISDLDEELGLVTVQAGVSFAQLSRFLRSRGSVWMPTVTGGSPHGSVIANALERGIGFGVHGNRIDTVCALEVVLATGELLRTGFARYPRARAHRVQRAGLGPSLDGLFAQSNLGVTTAATVWLTRRLRWSGWLEIGVPHRHLAVALVRYRALFESGMLRGVVKLSNGFGSAMSSGGSVRAAWRRARSAPWAGHLHVPSDDAVELAARLDYIAHSLRARAGITVERRPVQPMSEQAGPYAGIPITGGLAVLTSGSADPDALAADGAALPASAGVLFLCPAVPLTGPAVLEVVDLLTTVALDDGFLPYLTLNLMDQRVVHVVFGLFYDRGARGADHRAMQTYRRAFAACVRKGYYPYRLGIQSMDAMPPFSDDSGAVLARIRAALDPAGVLGRGTYQGAPPRRRAARPR